MQIRFDPAKSLALRANPKRGIGFEEAQEIFRHPYYDDLCSQFPDQFRAVGWVTGRLYTVIYEVRSDAEADFLWLVTLWKSTEEERKLYAQNA